MDGRSDLYSLGCVLYEMLTGEAPYSGTSAQAIMAKRLREPVPHVRTLRDAVPLGLEQALMRVLARTPTDRFPTAEAFVQALARLRSARPNPGSHRERRFLIQPLCGSRPAVAPPAAGPGARRPALRLLPYGLGLLAFAALVALVLTRGSLSGTGDRRGGAALGTRSAAPRRSAPSRPGRPNLSPCSR